MNASGYADDIEYYTIKNNVSSYFECEFVDKQKGIFEIPLKLEVFSYNYHASATIDPCYTSVNAIAKFTYDFKNNRWHINITADSLNLNSQAIIAE